MGKELSGRQKTVCAITFLTLSVTIFQAVVSYQMYSRSVDKYYKTFSRNMAWTAASAVDGMELEDYIMRTAEIYRQNPAPEFGSEEEEKAYLKQYEGIVDEGYNRLCSTLRKIRNTNHVHSLYIIYVDMASKTCVYVADGSDEDQARPIGTWGRIPEQSLELLENPRRGFPVSITDTEEFGRLCSSGVPVIRADGTVIAFVMADLAMDAVMKDKQFYLVKLCLISSAAAVLLICLSWLAVNHAMKEPEDKMGRETDVYNGNWKSSTADGGEGFSEPPKPGMEEVS